MEKRRKTVALVFPPVPSYSRKVIMGIVERHLAHRDWALIELPRMVRGECPFTLNEVRPDGVIGWAEAGDMWLHDLVDRGVPVVNCGLEWTGVPGIASVHYDFEDIHRLLIRHFMDLGFGQMVAIGHLLDKRPRTRKLLEGLSALANAAGLRCQVRELGGEDSPSVTPSRLLATDMETDLAAFLKGLRKPTAIYCFGDHIGYIVAEVASRLGLRIPNKIAIAGFGDNMVASFANPPLTTIDGAAHEVGAVAADCLAQWLETGRPPFDDRAIPGAELIERESTVGRSGSVVLESIHRYIDAHAKRGITLDELVAMSGLSVKTLVRRYRESFGNDPMSAIHQRRIGEIRALLENRSLSLAEVATACGFSSQTAFVNYFQRHAGCSPGGWRKQRAAGAA